MFWLMKCKAHICYDIFLYGINGTMGPMSHGGDFYTIINGTCKIGSLESMCKA